MSSADRFITLLAVIIGGLGVVGGGIWRVAAAVLKLAAEVKLLAWRVGQVEKSVQLAPGELAHRRGHGRL